ncbi:MAG: hypothetical protein AAB554_03065 [Patescibacteria group bacterium]|mgnify:CR=1 FL=1
MSGKKPSSTALMAIGMILPESVARAMYDWRRAFGSPPSQMYLGVDRDGRIAAEYVDPKAVRGDESYLIVEALSGRIVGILRDGALDAESHRLPTSIVACTLFRAAKA